MIILNINAMKNILVFQENQNINIFNTRVLIQNKTKFYQLFIFLSFNSQSIKQTICILKFIPLREQKLLPNIENSKCTTLIGFED